jgi:hypothetical protein
MLGFSPIASEASASTSSSSTASPPSAIIDMADRNLQTVVLVDEENRSVSVSSTPDVPTARVDEENRSTNVHTRRNAA